MTKRLPPLPDDVEYVSHNLVTLFINAPLDTTVDYIIETIYTHKKLKQVDFL